MPPSAPSGVGARPLNFTVRGTIMSWVTIIGGLLFVSGVMAPLIGRMFNRDFYAAAVILCMLGLLALSVGYRGRGGNAKRGAGNDGHKPESLP